MKNDSPYKPTPKQQLHFQKLFFNQTQDQNEQSKQLNHYNNDQRLKSEKNYIDSLNADDLLKDLSSSEEFSLDDSRNDLLEVNYQMIMLHTVIETYIDELVVEQYIFQPDILQDQGKLRFILIQYIKKTISKSIDQQGQFDIDIYLDLVAELQTLQHFIFHQYPYIRYEVDQYEEVLFYQSLTDQEFQRQFDQLHQPEIIRQIVQTAELEALFREEFLYDEVDKKFLKRIQPNLHQVGPLDDMLRKDALFDNIGKFNSQTKNDPKFSVSIRRDQKQQQKKPQQKPKNQIQLFSLPPITLDKPKHQQDKLNNTNLTYQQFIALIDKQKQKKQKQQEQNRQEIKKSQFDSILGRKTDTSSVNFTKPFIGQFSTKQPKQTLQSLFAQQSNNMKSPQRIQKASEQKSTPSFKPVNQQQVVRSNDMSDGSVNERVQGNKEGANVVNKQKISQPQQYRQQQLQQNQQPQLGNSLSRQSPEMKNASSIIPNITLNPSSQSNQPKPTQGQLERTSTSPASNTRNSHSPVNTSTTKPNSLNQNQQNPFISQQKVNYQQNSGFVPPPNVHNNSVHQNTTPIQYPTNNPLISRSTPTVINNSNIPNFSNLNTQTQNSTFNNYPPQPNNSYQAINKSSSLNALNKNAQQFINPLTQNIKPNHTLIQPAVTRLNQQNSITANPLSSQNVMPMTNMMNPPQVIPSPMIVNVPTVANNNKTKQQTMTEQKLPPSNELTSTQLSLNKVTQQTPISPSNQNSLLDMKLKDFINNYCHNELSQMYKDYFSQLLIARKWKLIDFQVDSRMKQKIIYLRQATQKKRDRYSQGRIVKNQKMVTNCNRQLRGQLASEAAILSQPYLMMKVLNNKLQQLQPQGLLSSSQKSQQTSTSLCTHQRYTKPTNVNKIESQFTKVEQVQSLIEQQLSTLQFSLGIAQNQKEYNMTIKPSQQLYSINKAMQNLQDWIIQNKLCIISSNHYQTEPTQNLQTLLTSQNITKNETLDFQTLTALYSLISHIDKNIQILNQDMEKMKDHS